MIALGTAICASRCAGASPVGDVLSVLCGDRGAPFVEHVESAARRYMVHPVTLASMLFVESRCRMDVVGKAGEVCAMQLLGVARNGHSKRELMDPRLCVHTAARWLSLRTSDCGETSDGGVAGYNARTCAGGKRYAKRVNASEAFARRRVSYIRRLTLSGNVVKSTTWPRYLQANDVTPSTEGAAEPRATSAMGSTLNSSATSTTTPKR